MQLRVIVKQVISYNNVLKVDSAWKKKQVYVKSIKTP